MSDFSQILLLIRDFQRSEKAGFVKARDDFGVSTLKFSWSQSSTPGVKLDLVKADDIYVNSNMACNRAVHNLGA